MRMAQIGHRNAGPGGDRNRAVTRVAALACGGFVLVPVIVVLVMALGSTATKGSVGKASAHGRLAMSSDTGGDASDWSGGATVTPADSGGGSNGGDSNGSDSNGSGAGTVSVVPSEAPSDPGATQSSFDPDTGTVSVVPTDPDPDYPGSNSTGSTGSSPTGVPPSRTPSDSNSAGNAGPSTVPSPSQGQVIEPAPTVSMPVVSTPTVCNRIVKDFDALHTALLTATATDVFCVRSSDSKPTAINAVSFARAALGTPYVWGGNGRSDGGYDCSGLTSAAYASAGLHLPRTAQLQYNAVPKLPAGAQIQPGDLVFFGSGPRSVTHVGIAISSTLMINAPQTGEVVKVAPLHRKDLVGVARPSDMHAAARSSS
jgi:cell wall-associated NlpC family hydrolase